MNGNIEQAVDGRIALAGAHELDALGYRVRVTRNSGESDEQFRKRVRASQSAAAQEAVEYQYRFWNHAGEGCWSTWAKITAEDHASEVANPIKGREVRALYAAPVAAAPVEITGVQLVRAMTAFDAAGGHQLSYAPLWIRKALEAASTPAALGIDTISILEIVAKYVERTSSAYRYIAEDLKRIDASPKGGSDAVDAARWRLIAPHISAVVHGSETRLILDDGQDELTPGLWVNGVSERDPARAIDAMQATSAEVGA